MVKIIYISGLLGSDKSVLSKKLELIKYIKVFDLDAIDNSNALELLEKTWMGITKFHKLKDKMNKISISLIIDKFKETYTYIFIGLLDEINKFATHKFFIKPDIITIYKQVNLRTLNNININNNEIKKLFNNCTTISDIEKCNSILFYKYKIIILFPNSKDGNDIQFMIQKKINEAKKHKFKILTTNKIYETIINLKK